MKNTSRLTAQIHLAAAFIFNLSILWIITTYARHAIHEPDIWWHLAHGRYMVENHTFLRSDIFSHTLAETPWTNFEWLSQIGAYLICHAFGLTGVYVAKTILSVTAVLFVGLAARQTGARGPLLTLLLWGGFHILQTRLCARIELVTLNLLGILVCLVLWTHASIEDHRSRFIPWVIGILLILWCNLHAGFIYGFGLLVSFQTGARAAKCDRRFIRILDFSVLLGLTGLILNPFGPRLLEIFPRVMSDFRHYPPSFLQEWATPTWTSAPYFWVFAGLCLFLIVGFSLRRDREALLWIPAVILFGLYGSRYFRSTALLAFVAIPFLAFAVGRIKQFWLSKGLNGHASPAWWLLCLIPLLIDGQYFVRRLPPGIIDGNMYPVGACWFVEKKEIDGRMYNPLGFGGYIDWVLGPQRKVFVDGRYIFYPIYVEEHLLASQLESAFQEASWNAYLEKYQIDYAITRYDEPVFHSENEFIRYRSIISFMFPKSAWALVYWDDASLVFVKRNQKFKTLISAEEYSYVNPYELGHMKELAAHDPKFKEKARVDIDRAIHEIGRTKRARWLAAAFN